MFLLLLGATTGPPPLPPWALPAVAAAAVVGVLLLGLTLLGRRRAPVQVVKEEPPNFALPREDALRDGKGEERRRWPRRGGNPTKVLIVVGKGRAQPVEGLVVDRSAGGLCLLVDQEVTKGSHLSVRAALAPEHVPWIEIKTVYSRQVGQRWQLGCQFVEMPPLSVLLFFG